MILIARFRIYSAIHVILCTLYSNKCLLIWEWSNAHFFLFCSLVIPANLEVVCGPWRNPVFFFGGGDHTVVWVGQVPGPFLVTFIYVINEFEKFPRGVKTLITPPPPFPSNSLLLIKDDWQKSSVQHYTTRLLMLVTTRLVSDLWFCQAINLAVKMMEQLFMRSLVNLLNLQMFLFQCLLLYYQLLGLNKSC